MAKVATAFITLLSITVATAFGRIAHVPSDYATIQAGILSCSDGDTVLVASGTYAGSGNRDIDFWIRAILVVSEAGPESTIIDCQGSSDHPHRGFYFHSQQDSTFILRGFTIRNGFVQGSDCGGAIYCVNSSSPLIESCHIENCRSMIYGGGVMSQYNAAPILRRCLFESNGMRYGFPVEGGGLACVDAKVYVDSCVFLNNSAENWGGAISLLGASGRITSCEFISNSTFSSGGAISQRYTNDVRISNCLFDSDSSGMGGGFYAFESPVYLDRCEYKNNEIYGVGGAVLVEGVTGTITNCNFNNNESDRGGDIESWRSSLQITNCLFYGSRSESNSNVNFSQSGTPVILNCTFYGGGIGIADTVCAPVIANSIFSYNLSGRAINCEYHRSIMVLSYCNIYGNRDGDWIGCIDDQINIRGNISVNPAFRDPNIYDFHLQSVLCGDSINSPCIDAGDPARLDDSLDCAFGLGTERSDMGAYGGGDTTMINIEEDIRLLPLIFELSQNYPNPFNPATSIAYSLPTNTHIKLTIYDILGRRVTTLFNGPQPAGEHKVIWDASAFPSGLYFARLEAGEKSQTVKMVLLK